MDQKCRARGLWIRVVSSSIAGPPRGKTIFFDSLPPHLEESGLLMVTQVAFRRTDLNVKLVSEFPVEARYRLGFRNSKMTQVPR